MQDGGARSQDEREVLRDELRLHAAKATSVADTAFPAQNPGQKRGPSRNWQKAWGPFCLHTLETMGPGALSSPEVSTQYQGAALGLGLPPLP